MLEALFGNKTVEQILLFLFVNGRCYGTRMQKQLKCALTPIQKGLQRLENGGIVTSSYEGKTRQYQLNPSHPLHQELELLLKKTFTLLPTEGKKCYYLPFQSPYGDHLPENSQQVLLTFWNKLSAIRQLSYIAKSNSHPQNGKNGQGKGVVIAEKEGNSQITFTEKGQWVGKESGSLDFTNVFRWRLDRSKQMIALEHLRYGRENPVFLFHLAPTSETQLTSIDSHLCAGDSYFGNLTLTARGLSLHWRVIGTKKNDEIIYYYSW